LKTRKNSQKQRWGKRGKDQPNLGKEFRPVLKHTTKRANSRRARSARIRRQGVSTLRKRERKIKRKKKGSADPKRWLGNHSTATIIGVIPQKKKNPPKKEE